MKKIFLFTLLISFSYFAFSQSPTPPPAKSSGSSKKFRFGFKVAPNIAWLKSDDKLLKNNGSPIGFSYGFNVDYKLAKNFSFNSGFDVTNINGKLSNKYPLNYIKSDPTLDTSIKSISTNFNLKIKYIEIPLMFTGKTNEIGYFTYFIQGGICPGILIGQKAEISPSTGTIEGTVQLNSERKDEYTNANDDFKFFRLGFLIGAGAEYAIGGGTSLVGSFRFNNGLLQTLKNAGGNYNRVINNYISLNIGIVF